MQIGEPAALDEPAPPSLIWVYWFRIIGIPGMLLLQAALVLALLVLVRTFRRLQLSGSQCEKWKSAAAWLGLGIALPLLMGMILGTASLLDLLQLAQPLKFWQWIDAAGTALMRLQLGYWISFGLYCVIVWALVVRAWKVKAASHAD